MKTLSIIIAAALVSGSGYAQQADVWQILRDGREWQAQFDARQEAARQREQLEDIRAAQRRQEYCPLPDMLLEIERSRELRRQEWRQEEYLRHYLEDCDQ